jgi:hypothetical protein
LASQELADPGAVDMSPLALNDNERKIGHMVAGDNLDHGESPMATSAERMPAKRARRRKNLVQVTLTIASEDLDQIARSGYPGVKPATRQPPRRWR